MTKKRNGEIDLLRFLFSIIIVFFHFNEFYDFGIFARGDIFVEFFFIVTGFLMAKSAEKLARSKEQFTQKEIADSTWKFTFNKVKTIFSYYISVVLIQLIVRYVIMRGSDLRTIVVGLFRSLPTFTLSFFGLIYVDDVSFYVGNTWFLSAMFIAILILFPLMLKAYDHSVKILFPLLGMFLLGYIYTRYGTIVIWANWMGYCYVGILRAVAEIAIGAFLYFLSCVIREKYGKLITTKNVPFKIILTLFKAGLFATVILFANGSDFGRNLTPYRYCNEGAMPE